MVVDIPVKCCVRLLHFVLILFYLTFRDGEHKAQCTREIKSKMAIAKSTFNKKKAVVNRELDLKFKG